MDGWTDAYFLIRVARGDGKHVGFISKHFSPVPLTGFHAVLKVVLVIRIEGLRTRRKTDRQHSWYYSAVHMIGKPARPTQRQTELDAETWVRVSETHFLNDSEKYGSTLVWVVECQQTINDIRILNRPSATSSSVYHIQTPFIYTTDKKDWKKPGATKQFGNSATYIFLWLWQTKISKFQINNIIAETNRSSDLKSLTNQYVLLGTSASPGQTLRARVP